MNRPKNYRYNLVAEKSQSAVVTEYSPDKNRAAQYQSEAELERAFIAQLESQAYEYLSITSETDLVCNLRKQLESLNDFTFSDSEWDHMDDFGLIFTMLGERATTAIHRNEDSKGMAKLQNDAQAGGTIAGGARHELEKKIGRSIVSQKNYLPEKKAVRGLKNGWKLLRRSIITFLDGAATQTYVGQCLNLGVIPL